MNVKTHVLTEQFRNDLEYQSFTEAKLCDVALLVFIYN
jgi:hypothetical protein